MCSSEQTNQSIDAYLSGDRLVGDDYNEFAIRQWYADEKEGYAGLGAADTATYAYSYHALNRSLLFSKLPARRELSVLGIGSAYGDELLPIAGQIGSITILEPSDSLVAKSLAGIPITYRKPNPLGNIEFEDASFDLVTCFGVLHHVPNVSFVISEIGRVLRPGGFMLVREPAVSMGDWRKPRRGLTRRERGIPERVMGEAIEAAGLTVVSKNNCDFAAVSKLSKALGVSRPFNNSALTLLDRVFSTTFAWNKRYHRTSTFQKLAPASIAWVLQKPALQRSPSP